MGVTFQAYESHSSESVRQERVATQGMDHLYLVNESVQVEVVEASVETVKPEGAESEALQVVIQDQLTQIHEQTKRLEAASYRIGYLQALLKVKDDQLLLLTTKVQKRSFWQVLFGH